MKDLFIYYFEILLPVPLLYWAAGMNAISFFLLLSLYVLAYRPLIDAYRLLRKSKIQQNEIWKLFIPFWRLKYFKELYFEF